jgi:hypothetical protein
VHPNGFKAANFKKIKKPGRVGNRIYKVEQSPEEIEERYGNFKVIKPTREDAIMLLTHQKESATNLQNSI